VAVIAPERPHWLPAGQTFFHDHPDARGPMAGILAALEWAGARGGSHVLVLAVDLPRMMPHLLQKLAGACRAGQGLIPANDSQLEPLCAIYPVEALPVLLKLARSGCWKLQDAVTDLRTKGLLMAQNLLPEEKPMFFNLNSPEDLLVLRAP
jgi:molybdopterin-guanine dinucleotide biosynthesis protein A